MDSKAGFRIEIEHYLDSLRVERGASEHTIAGYETDLIRSADFFASLGIESWENLTEQSLVEFRIAMGKGVQPGTLRRRISSLRSLLKYLKKRGRPILVDLPSAAGVVLPKRIPKALTWEELEKMLDAADLSTPLGLRDRALMEVIYGTGLRISETINLSVLDVDSGVNSFRVKGKRGKVRIVPIPRHTLPWLMRYLDEARPKIAERAEGRYFVGSRGAALSRQNAYLIIDKYQKLSGIAKRVSPHTLRHTYAVHLVKGGADLRVVQELLGHSDISTTQVYTQLDMDAVRQNYDRAHPRK